MTDFTKGLANETEEKKIQRKRKKQVQDKVCCVQCDRGNRMQARYTGHVCSGCIAAHLADACAVLVHNKSHSQQ